MTTPAAKAPQQVVERFFQFSLLGMLASGYFAVLGSGYLDWPTTILTLAALCFRVLMIAGVWRLDTLEVPGRIVTAVTVLYICFYPVDYYYISNAFLPAAVHLIFFLGSVKLLTARTMRDFTYVKVIAAMALLAAAVLSASLAFFAFLTVFLLFTIATLSSGEVVRATRLFLSGGESRRALSRSGMRAFPRRLGMLSFGLFGGILVLTAGVFFVLPRTARAAFQRFVPEHYHLPGFSSEVTLGEIGEIKQSSTPVMHVYSQGDGFLAVRWRGAALTHFDGKRWFNLPAVEERLRPEGRRVLLRDGPSLPGRRIDYEVRLSDVASDVLFVAGTPESMIIDVPVVSRSSSGTLRAPRINGAGLRYAVASLLDEEASPNAQLAAAARIEALALPPLDERIPRLALDMTAGLATPEEKARALERRLRHDYGYTLQLLPAPVADPLATFLFARKKGHCEYFASAMAVMLRTLGIPARVVTGFLGGVYNPMTGWQVVRASDAHSWVEAWLPRRGWVTFDPTPPDPSPSSVSLWTRAGLVMDAADQFWQDWVVGYDFEHQITLAARMQESGRNFRFPWPGSEAAAQLESGIRAARAYVVEIFGLIALAGLAILYGPGMLRKLRADLRVRRAQRGEAQASDATMLYERMLRVLERRGMQKPPWLTPAEFARVLPSSELAMLVDDLTSAYNQFRFGGRHDAAPRMVRLLRRIETLESR